MKFESIILALINIHPSISGYELKAIINKSTGYFFSATLSMIYPALKELHGRGYVTFEVEPLIGKQDRKVYSITPAGVEALKEALRQPLDFEKTLDAFQDFLLKLTFMGIMEDAAILAYLRDSHKFFKDELNRFIDNNLANEKEYIQMGPALDQRHLMLWMRENDFIIEDLAKKVSWIEGLIETVESQAREKVLEQ